MNIIHIFTEVKRQSFNELAKATERKRHNERRRIFTRRLQKMVNHLVYYKEAVSRLYPSVQVRKKHLSWG